MKKKLLAIIMTMAFAVTAVTGPETTANAAVTVNDDGSTTSTTQSKSGDGVTTTETTTTDSKSKFVAVTKKNVITGETDIELTSYDSSGKEVSYSEYVVQGVLGNTVKLTHLSTSESLAIVPDSIKSCGEDYLVYKIGAKALAGNDSIKSQVVGKNVIAIGEGAFMECSNLKTVTLNTDLINYVGENAFDGIDKNTTISIKAKKAAYKLTAKWIKLSGIAKTVKFKRI